MSRPQSRTAIRGTSTQAVGLLLVLAVCTAPAPAQVGSQVSRQEGLGTASSIDDGDHQRTQRSPQVPQTVFRQGRVLLASGGPPPAGTGVEMVCRGGEAIETSTDKEGRFTLSWAAVRGAGPPEPGAVGIGRIGQDASYVDCDVQVQLVGYSSKRARRAGVSASGPSLGMFLLFPNEPGAASVISITSFEAPDNARKAYRQAVKELTRSKPDLDKATAALRKAVEAFPEYAAAWTQLGRTLARQRNFAQAREALEQAVAADPSFVGPYPLLAGIAFRRQDWPALVSAAEQTLALRPGDVEANYYLALGRMGLQQFDQALIAAQQVAQSPLAQKFPRAFHILGAIHTMQGRFPEAAKALQRYLELQPNSRLAANIQALLTEWRAAGKLEPPTGDATSKNHLLGALVP